MIEKSEARTAKEEIAERRNEKGRRKRGGVEGRGTEEGIRKERDEISRYNGVLARALRRSDKLSLRRAREASSKGIGRRLSWQ